MKSRIAQNRVQIQFGSLTTDSEGTGGVIIDAIDPKPGMAVVLSPDAMVNAAAFEIDASLYHVTISAQQESNINYIAVSSD